MAIQLTGPATLSTPASSILSGQQVASVAFRVRCDVPPPSGYFHLLGRQYSSGVYFDALPSGPNAELHLTFDTGSTSATAVVTLPPGATEHIAVTWDGSAAAQTLYLNGVASSFGSKAGTLVSGNSAWQIGANSIAGNQYTLEDVAVWHGYALTQADARALRDRTATPQTLSTPCTYRWTLAGTAGADVAANDPGIVETVGGQSGNAFGAPSLGTGGTAIYTAPLPDYAPPVHISTARVSTSGRMVFLFPTAVVGGAWQAITSLDAAPTISINGGAPVTLINPWNTGNHTCIGYFLPAGTVVQPGDAVTISAPGGWASTAAGEVEAMTSRVVTNLAGKANFGSDTAARTLKMGVNFSDLGTSYYTYYQLFKDWRHRLAGWPGSSATTIDGYPSQLSGTEATAMLISTNDANGLDGTNYPGPTGLFAIRWDDPNGTDSFSFDALTACTSITERTDLRNNGDGAGLGKVRVFDVQWIPGSPTADVSLQVRLASTGGTPTFRNLAIYGPGDFTATANQPVTLDVSDPFALSGFELDRLGAGAGSCRFADSILSWQGVSGLTEVEQHRRLDDFCWALSRERQDVTFSQLRPFAPGPNAYIYAGWLGGTSGKGADYAVTLGAPVSTTPAAGTQETWTLSAPDAYSPILRGLILRDGGEACRVVKVNGDGTFLVERGSLGTTPATHAAGSIQCSGRLNLPSFAAMGAGYLCAEFVSPTPHNLITGTYLSSNSSWPDASLPTYGGGAHQIERYTIAYTNTAFVTGPDSVLVWLTNESTVAATQAATIDAPVSLDVTRTTPPYSSSWLGLPETSGFPYAAAAKIVAAMPGAAFHCNLPAGLSDAAADWIAAQVRDNLPAGREVWLELGNEIWNGQVGPAISQFFCVLSNVLGLGTGLDAYDSYVWRAAQLRDRFKAVFGARAGEVKLLIGSFIWDAGTSSTPLARARSLGAKIDAVAIAPYVDPDASRASILAYNQADIDQAVDLWIHDLWCKQSNGYPAAINAHVANINAHNAATGDGCRLYAYEGGYQTGIPVLAPTLTAAIDAVTTTVPVSDAGWAGFCPGMYLAVDSEWLYVTAVSGNTLTVTRGANGTTAAPHGSGAAIQNAIAKHRERDMKYHPNWYFAEQDMYLLWQTLGFYHFNIYSYDRSYMNSSCWGMYVGIRQQYGRGDGSDGKHDNRTTVATPGLSQTKSASTSLDQANVSVRGAAWRDWNALAGADHHEYRFRRGPRASGRGRIIR